MRMEDVIMAPTTEEIYRDVPAEQRDELFRFRDTHAGKRLTTRGATWDYIVSGQGDQAVVVLGGALSTGEAAYRTITRWEQTYHVLAPSYPQQRRLYEVMDGLADLMDAEGIASAHVYGHSLGALVAHGFVRRHPTRVDKLILGGFGIYSSLHTLAASMFFKLPYSFLQSYYEKAVRRLAAGAGDAEQKFYAAYTQDLFYLQQTPETFRCQMALLLDGMGHSEDYHLFEPVTRPGRVLIIGAHDDRGFSDSERRALISTYPGAQVKIFDSGGHWVSATHAGEYKSVLDAFLES
jgi:pimeloyl-ACP methyl ester carboxylesterase